MKNLVSGILGIFICGYSYAEVDTKVYNNYLSLYIPEIAPHSKLIKRQDIYTSIDYSDAMRFIDGKLVIESNNRGLIIFSGNEKYKSTLFYDYVKNIIVWNMNDKPFTQIKLTLDKDENIIESSSLNSFNFHYQYDYDEQKRLVMSWEMGQILMQKTNFSIQTIIC